MIIVVYVCLILLREFQKPIRSRWLRRLLLKGQSRGRATYSIRVEILGPWNFFILEEMLMPSRRYWCIEFKDNIGIMNIATIHVDVCMRGNGCDCEEERIFGFDGIIQEAVCFFSDYVCAVLTFIASRGLACALQCAVEVVISERIKKEVLRMSVKTSEG